MKILFILSRFPYPLEKGDKLRAYQHIMHLKASGHEVHLAAISDIKVKQSELDKIIPLCSSVTVIPLSVFDVAINVIASFFRKLPIQAGYFYSSKNQEKINSVISKVNPDLIYCQLIRTALYIQKHKSFPRVIDYQDAFSKGTFQRMHNAPWWLKPIFKRELPLVKKLEEQSYDWFDGHLIISEQDREALAVSHDKSIAVVPNGVDTGYFFPDSSEKKIDITFVGNMKYPPNVDGACFLVEEIMPLVWKNFPETIVQIAGANPSKKVRELASDQVFVTGWIPDIRHSYRSTKVFVAPMRIGTGLQNKLLEAMAMGIPCVTTPLSFEPLKANAGIDILVGSDAAAIAGKISDLLKNEDLRYTVGRKGLDFVVANYSMEHSRILLDKEIKNALVKFKQGRGQL